MLPLQQAYVVMQSAIEYIKATFRFKDASVYNAFYKFVEYRDKAFIYTLCSSVNDRTMPQKTICLRFVLCFMWQLPELSKRF
ncbi:MAG: hypothetical protein AB7V54_12380 [Parabacteroides sp.]|jgi:N-acetyl-gamma-glutamylphosphate reductase